MRINLLTLYLQPRVLAVFFLGFSSGLPLALTASTLGIWLTEAGINKATIGLFAAVGTPYTLKFLWAPLMDSVNFPILGKWLGQRRGWLIATQLAIAAGLLMMGLMSPDTVNPWIVACFALFVATCSASQDIVIDAYRVEILKEEEQGAGAAVIVLGYRFGMIAATAGALYLAEYFGWMMAYWVMAALMGVGIITALLAGEPANHKPPKLEGRSFNVWIKEAVIAPFADFMTRRGWLAILLFIVLYKFADAFMGVMTSPFYIEIGFSKEDIAKVVKLYGLVATIAGGFVGGAIVYRLGMLKSLWLCGIFQALTNLVFVLLAKNGADIQLLTLCITLENAAGGMGTAVFVAFMSSLCNLRFTATQYALMSSLAAFGRTWLSTPAGSVAEHIGWEAFFICSTLLAIPGLALLWWLPKGMKDDAISGETKS
ncbi:MAG: AmpG family muropeptide MFS transporter [Alphaproteobacteria bacterium]